jgi:glycosyltransferase involved in cell wall biosynthesis
LFPALCLDTAHSQKTKIPTFFLALTPLITKFRERWGLVFFKGHPLFDFVSKGTTTQQRIHMKRAQRLSCNPNQEMKIASLEVGMNKEDGKFNDVAGKKPQTIKNRTIQAEKRPLIYMVAPLAERIPPENYGGIEGQVALLVDGLAKRDFKVILFAAGTSQGLTKADSLVSVVENPLREDQDMLEKARHLQVQKVLSMAARQRPDVLHTHMWTEALVPLSARCKSMNLPIVQTLHNGFEPRDFGVFSQISYPIYVAISRNQSAILKSHAPSVKHRIIHNGVESVSPTTNLHLSNAHSLLPEVRKWLGGRSYLAWVGRFVDQKGPHLAIELALKLNMPLVLAGKLAMERDESREYFKKCIEPYLTEKYAHLISYIGLVTPSQRQELFAHASAAVLPTQWEEPFGLTVVEAMAVGTPVVTCKYGASPELVGKEGGIVVNTMDEAVHRFSELLSLRRQRVMKRAETFKVERMVEKYAALYANLIESHVPSKVTYFFISAPHKPSAPVLEKDADTRLHHVRK